MESSMCMMETEDYDPKQASDETIDTTRPGRELVLESNDEDEELHSENVKSETRIDDTQDESQEDEEDEEEEEEQEQDDEDENMEKESDRCDDMSQMTENKSKILKSEETINDTKAAAELVLDSNDEEEDKTENGIDDETQNLSQEEEENMQTNVIKSESELCNSIFQSTEPENTSLNETKNINELKKNLCYEEEFRSINHKEQIHIFLKMKPLTQQEMLKQNNQTLFKINTDTSVSVKPPKSSVYFQNKTISQSLFQFSYVFQPTITQKDFFSATIYPCFERFFNGDNLLIFSYGVTNSGKTFTMQGTNLNPGLIPRTLDYLFDSLSNNLETKRTIYKYKPDKFNEIVSLSESDLNSELALKEQLLKMTKDLERTDSFESLNTIKPNGAGISNLQDSKKFGGSLDSLSTILKSETDLNGTCTAAFGSLNGRDSDLSPIKVPDNKKYAIWISFYELYNDSIFDLLAVSNGKSRATMSGNSDRVPLKIREDSSRIPYVEGLIHIPVFNTREAIKVLKYGEKNLQKSSNSINLASSRSHAVFCLKIVCISTNETLSTVSINQLSFCDLAGIERSSKTHAVGKTQKEASAINKSLLSLSQCMRTMIDNQKNKIQAPIPYRTNKLTRLFQAYFEGRSMVKMVVNLNPSISCFDESVGVLKFASVANQIQLELNEDDKVEYKIENESSAKSRLTVGWESGAPGDTTRDEYEESQYEEATQYEDEEEETDEEDDEDDEDEEEEEDEDEYDEEDEDDDDDDEEEETEEEEEEDEEEDESMEDETLEESCVTNKTANTTKNKSIVKSAMKQKPEIKLGSAKKKRSFDETKEDYDKTVDEDEEEEEETEEETDNDETVEETNCEDDEEEEDDDEDDEDEEDEEEEEDEDEEEETEYEEESMADTTVNETKNQTIDQSTKNLRSILKTPGNAKSSDKASGTKKTPSKTPKNAKFAIKEASKSTSKRVNIQKKVNIKKTPNMNKTTSHLIKSQTNSSFTSHKSKLNNTINYLNELEDANRVENMSREQLINLVNELKSTIEKAKVAATRSEYELRNELVNKWSSRVEENTTYYQEQIKLQKNQVEETYLKRMEMMSAVLKRQHQGDIDKIQQTNKELEKQIEGMEEQIKETELKLEKICKERDELQSKVDELGRRSIIRSNEEQYKEQIDYLISENNELKSGQDQLKEEISQLNTKYEDMRSQRDGLNKELFEANKTIKDSVLNLENLKNKLDCTESERQLLDEQLKTKTEKLYELNDEVSRKDDEISHLAKRNAEMSIEMDRSSREMAKVKCNFDKQLNDAQFQINSLEKTIEELEQNNKKNAEEVKRNADLVKKLNKEKADLESEIKKLNTKIDELKKEVKNKESTITDLQEELDKASLATAAALSAAEAASKAEAMAIAAEANAKAQAAKVAADAEAMVIAAEETAKAETAKAKAEAEAEAAKAKAEAEAAKREALKIEAARLEAVKLETARLEAAKAETAKIEAAKSSKPPLVKRSSKQSITLEDSDEILPVEEEQSKPVKKSLKKTSRSNSKLNILTEHTENTAAAAVSSEPPVEKTMKKISRSSSRLNSLTETEEKPTETVEKSEKSAKTSKATKTTKTKTKKESIQMEPDIQEIEDEKENTEKPAKTSSKARASHNPEAETSSVTSKKKSTLNRLTEMITKSPILEPLRNRPQRGKAAKATTSTNRDSVASVASVASVKSVDKKTTKTSKKSTNLSEAIKKIDTEDGDTNDSEVIEAKPTKAKKKRVA